MSAPPLPFSPACERNRQPILEALRVVLPLPPDPLARPLRILEVGSGTGQHAVHMARHLRGVHWQTSDRGDDLDGLRRRVALEGSSGLAPGSAVAPPLVLDVTQEGWPDGPFDAVFTANTAHIMPAEALPDLLSGSARVLREGGLLVLYGPFRYGAVHTAASNAAFDAHLRAIDPAMGVRDAQALERMARPLGLEPLADRAMPAENRLLVFVRRGGGSGP